MICTINGLARWHSTGAHYTPEAGEGDEQGASTTSPVLLQRYLLISDKHSLPLLCKSEKLSTAPKSTRKSFQQGDNSNCCPGVLTCKLSIFLTSCLFQAFSSTQNRKAKEVALSVRACTCISIHAHTCTHTPLLQQGVYAPCAEL